MSELFEWLSAILVTLVIKISWALRQTMESLEAERATANNTRFFSAYADMDYSDNAIANVAHHASFEQVQGTSMDKKSILMDTENPSPVTSTPVLKGGKSERILSPNVSEINNQPLREMSVDLSLESVPAEREPSPENIQRERERTPEALRRERQLIEHYCMMYKPTESDGEVIRTAFARGPLSPETQLKYRKFLNAPVSNQKKFCRSKNLRL